MYPQILLLNPLKMMITNTINYFVLYFVNDEIITLSDNNKIKLVYHILNISYSVMRLLSRNKNYKQKYQFEITNKTIKWEIINDIIRRQNIRVMIFSKDRGHILPVKC